MSEFDDFIEELESGDIIYDPPDEVGKPEYPGGDVDRYGHLLQYAQELTNKSEWKATLFESQYQGKSERINVKYKIGINRG